MIQAIAISDYQLLWTSPVQEVRSFISCIHYVYITTVYVVTPYDIGVYLCY